MTADHYWACLGVAPKQAPCGASGTNDADAERHTKATKHATTSGTRRGAAAVARAFEEPA